MESGDANVMTSEPTGEQDGFPSPVVTGAPTEVAGGVWVIPDGGVPLVPNIGIVLGERAGLVVDTGMGPANGVRVRQAAEGLAGDRALLLTLTHFHPEHGYGAQAFAAGATIVYNRDQRDELVEKGTRWLEAFRGLGEAVAEQLVGVELVMPHVVYDGEAEIDLGGRVLQLRSCGLAHSRADQVVFLPAERVLFTGDLVENGNFAIVPYYPPTDVDIDVDRWIAALDGLVALDPAVVVPGHGPVGDVGVIKQVREYLAALRSETQRLAADGLDVEEIVARVERSMVEQHPDWTQREWIGLGVRCVHDALTR